jgi:hypothetical protein
VERDYKEMMDIV